MAHSLGTVTPPGAKRTVEEEEFIKAAIALRCSALISLFLCCFVLQDVCIKFDASEDADVVFVVDSCLSGANFLSVAVFDVDFPSGRITQILY